MTKKTIGIFDSGKGGFETLKYLKQDFKHLKFIYYADKTHAPYGTKNKDELLKIISNIIKRFEKRKVQYILIACNTASTLIKDLQKLTRIKLVSVIDATFYYINQYNIISNNTLLIATKFTINQKIYQEKFNTITCIYNNDLINNLQNNEPYDLSFLKIYENQCFDLVLLACTHLSVIEKDIRNYIQFNFCINTAHVFNLYLKNSLKLKK